jgi:hypothetical protein
MQRFADSLLTNHSCNLWSEVTQICGKRAIPVSSVDGCLTELFADEYQNVYNNAI